MLYHYSQQRHYTRRQRLSKRYQLSILYALACVLVCLFCVQTARATDVAKRETSRLLYCCSTDELTLDDSYNPCFNVEWVITLLQQARVNNESVERVPLSNLDHWCRAAARRVLPLQCPSDIIHNLLSNVVADATWERES